MGRGAGDAASSAWEPSCVPLHLPPSLCSGEDQPPCGCAPPATPTSCSPRASSSNCLLCYPGEAPCTDPRQRNSAADGGFIRRCGRGGSPAQQQQGAGKRDPEGKRGRTLKREEGKEGAAADEVARDAAKEDWSLEIGRASCRERVYCTV